MHVIVAAWKWASTWARARSSAACACAPSSYARDDINLTMCGTKATGRLHSTRRWRCARRRPASYDEALLLDVDGYVAEGSGDVFLIRKA